MHKLNNVLIYKAINKAKTFNLQINKMKLR